jgi:hypothetical protein
VRALFDGGGDPFVHALGFATLSQPVATNGALSAIAGAPPAGVALVVAPWGERLDRFWRPAVTFARENGVDWALLFNGTHARLVDASRVFMRRYLQFDLDDALEDSATFAAMWAVLCASAVSPATARGSSAMRRAVEQSERHALEVCGSLRDGVLTAAEEVLAAMGGRRPPLTPAATLDQALTVVYRILFLLFAEARALVPVWHPVYRQSYSLEALRVAAESGATPAGIWDALRAVTRLAHAGCHAGTLRVTPFNGRLFAPATAPLTERRHLDDRAAAKALLALSTRPARDRAGREPIGYGDLGVEQLGAVYETLLDYTPVRSTPDSPIELRPGSGVRKSTGTFYTPQPLAAFLVRRTLAPLVSNRGPEEILNLRIVDPAMGSGAFLVAAAAYLAHEYENALVTAGGYHPSDFGPFERASILRTIAERCLFGVDVNPMAVQLARLSLWLATLAADRPLSFLDHHLQAGDSLVGAWVSALTGAPRRRRQRAGSTPLFRDLEIAGSMRDVVPVRFDLATAPSDTVEQVRAKERALASLNRLDSPLSLWKRIADVWCAGWFGQEGEVPAAAFRALADVILTGRGDLPPRLAARHLDAARTIAAERRFFHWELEFPEVFFDANGRRLPDAGFDAVLGNPPWDMVRADSGSRSERTRAQRDISAYLRFTRESGFYEAQSDGHANRYQLFVERAVTLLKPGGRLGLIVPSGLVMDHGSIRLRQWLFRNSAVDAVVGFDNRDAVFPIHRSIRFLLFTGTAGAPTHAINCRLGERNVAALETGDDTTGPDWFPVRVSRPLLQRISGDSLALPDLRSPLDLAILEKACALFQPLGSANGWQVRFGRELNAADDRPLFKKSGGGVPVIEGKAIAPFRVLHDAIRWSVTAAAARSRLADRYDRPRLAYRDVASVTNRTTLIAAVLPAPCVTTHTLFCLRTRVPLLSQYFLCGLFNSLVVNYLVRLRVTTHVTTSIVEGLPAPVRDEAPLAFVRIAGWARRLARCRLDESSREWAQLNATVARLYQLTEGEFRHVLATFPLIEQRARERALRAYDTV